MKGVHGERSKGEGDEFGLWYKSVGRSHAHERERGTCREWVQFWGREGEGTPTPIVSFA